MRALIDTPSHRVRVESDRHAGSGQELERDLPALGGNLFHDFHASVLMREHGISRIYTRDADFRRFDCIEVIDPLV